MYFNSVHDYIHVHVCYKPVEKINIICLIGSFFYIPEEMILLYSYVTNYLNDLNFRQMTWSEKRAVHLSQTRLTNENEKDLIKLSDSCVKVILLYIFVFLYLLVAA